MSQKKCPECGKPIRYYYSLCYDCNLKDKQKPKCEVCGISVKDGWYLCNKHYNERKAQKEDLFKIKYVKNKKEKEFIEKFRGKYYPHMCFCNLIEESQMVLPVVIFMQVLLYCTESESSSGGEEKDYMHDEWALFLFFGLFS